MEEAISKAATLLEALPYIQRFRGQIFVVKYGGSFMDSDNLEVRHRVARDVVFLEAVGINPVVVHGGGKAITRALEIAGLKAQFVQGHRVTNAAAAEIVDRVLSREINPEIVKAIEEFGGKARGFAGPDLFRCRKLLPPNQNVAGPASGGQLLQEKRRTRSRQTDGRSGATQPVETTGCPAGASRVDLGFVGEVVEVNTEPLRECIRRSVTPVISPTARGDDGKIYNCNADVAAAKAAIALKARRLVFMSDVPGLLSNPKDDATLMRHLCVAEVPALKQHGVIGEGMLPKVDSAVAAIESGVEKVQFVDGRIPHSVLLEIFTDAGVGTEVVK
jgi:acetylglutamate kinase